MSWFTKEGREALRADIAKQQSALRDNPGSIIYTCSISDPVAHLHDVYAGAKHTLRDILYKDGVEIDESNFKVKSYEGCEYLVYEI